jgi:NADH dehydrogenase FAD-containing subunit
MPKAWQDLLPREALWNGFCVDIRPDVDEFWMGRCNPQSLAVPDSLKHLDGLGDVQVLYKTSVTSMDLHAKTVKTSSGKSLHYDKLIIATGATASKWVLSLLESGIHS